MSEAKALPFMVQAESCYVIDVSACEKPIETVFFFFLNK